MKELASEFGIHRTTVSTHLAEQGVPIRRGGLDQAQTAEAVRLYEAGWSSGRLAETFGVGADTVLTALRRAGASIRPPQPSAIHAYNHHRPHTAIGGPAINRVNDLPAHYT